MAIVLNCVLFENSHDFTVNVNEINTIADSKVELGHLKIGQLKYIIWKQQEAIEQRFDLMKLWKIDISKFKSDITEEQIKMEGEQLKSFVYFLNYFPNQVAADKSVIIVQAAIGSSRGAIEAVSFRGAIEAAKRAACTGPCFPNVSDSLAMPLQQRNFEDAMRKVDETVYSNITKRIGKSNYWCLVSGGAPGIGKTRFGQELFNQIKNDLPKIYAKYDIPQEIRWTGIHFEYLLIDFANGYALTEKDYKLNASAIIGLRIAYAYFIEKEYMMTFQEFYIAIEAYAGKDRLIDLFTINVVISEIHSSLNLPNGRKIFLYLHIDEFQLIDLWDKKDISTPPIGLFYNMIHIISTYMLSTTHTFVMPFLSGTAPLAVIEQKEASRISFYFVECPLLNIESIIQIMDYFAEKFKAGIKNYAYKWKFSFPMLQLLEDTGGLPRALERLFIVCFGPSGLNGKEFFARLETEKIVFASIFYDVMSALDGQYNIKAYVRKNKQVALKLLSYCIEGTPVSGEEILDKDSNITIRSLERDKHIILSLSSKDDSFIIKLPFYFICLYNDVLDIVDLQLTKKLFEENIYWQELEKFVAYHETFRTNLKIRLGKTHMKLQELYPCASELDEYFNYTVKLKELHVCESSEQFPTTTTELTNKSNDEKINWKSGNVVVINGKSAKSADVILVREVDCKLKLLVMNQCKWDYGSVTMYQDQVDDEDKKNLDSFFKYIGDCTYIPITNIFTSRPYEGGLREDVTVISKENFKKHFGPVFSSRAKFAIIKEINPNFWDRNRLLNTLEGVGAASIDRALEKRPYFDDKGYLEVNPGAKNKKQKLDYFPFNISKKLTIENRDTSSVHM